jgi:hypothetical protein
MRLFHSIAIKNLLTITANSRLSIERNRQNILITNLDLAHSELALRLNEICIN